MMMIMDGNGTGCSATTKHGTVTYRWQFNRSMEVGAGVYKGMHGCTRC